MITKLEQSMIDSARDHLRSLRDALTLPVGVARDAEVAKEFFSLSSLVMFCHFDSGLSEDASQMLHDIELESATAMSADQPDAGRLAPVTPEELLGISPLPKSYY